MNLEKIFDGKGNEHNLESNKTGDLDELTTDAKDSFVSAINEVDGRVPKVAPESNEGLFLRVVNGALALQELTDVSQKTELTDYVIMPGECYQALCDLIREKTGEIDSLTIRRLLEKVKPLFDVSAVTATANDVLEGKTIVDVDGDPVEGTMPNRGSYGRKLSPNIPYVPIREGYHDGTGVVQAAYESYKIVLPTKKEQTINGETFEDDDGIIRAKFLGSVTVRAIPDQYQDVTAVTATSEDVRAGKVIVDASGEEKVGTLSVWEGGSY